jgi:hypothetical protein
MQQMGRLFLIRFCCTEVLDFAPRRAGQQVRHVTSFAMKRKEPRRRGSFLLQMFA